MNREPLLGPESRHLGALELDETQVSGTGGATYPRIIFRGRLEYYQLHETKNDYAFKQLNAQLIASGREKIGDALPMTLDRVQRWHWEQGGQDAIALEFLIDARRLVLLEQIRSGG